MADVMGYHAAIPSRTPMFLLERIRVISADCEPNYAGLLSSNIDVYLSVLVCV